MTAKLKPTIPSGGILSQHVDQDFGDFVAGRPGTQRVVVGVVETAGISSGNQDKGRVNHTAYEFLHLVEITDGHEADRLRSEGDGEEEGAGAVEADDTVPAAPVIPFQHGDA